MLIHWLMAQAAASFPSSEFQCAFALVLVPKASLSHRIPGFCATSYKWQLSLLCSRPFSPGWLRPEAGLLLSSPIILGRGWMDGCQGLGCWGRFVCNAPVIFLVGLRYNSSSAMGTESGAMVTQYALTLLGQVARLGPAGRDVAGAESGPRLSEHDLDPDGLAWGNRDFGSVWKEKSCTRPSQGLGSSCCLALSGHGLGPWPCAVASCFK